MTRKVLAQMPLNFDLKNASLKGFWPFMPWDALQGQKVTLEVSWDLAIRSSLLLLVFHLGCT